MLYHYLVIAGLVLLVVYTLTATTMEGFADPQGMSERSTGDTPSPITSCMTDPLDMEWIASWSAADRVARYGQVCAPYYVEPGPANTKIWIVSKSCEQGLAHTRDGDRIIIPDNIHMGERETTIQHELIHISQHRYPTEWAAFYRRNWAFTVQKNPPAGMPTSITAARRSNPDTWREPWACWMGRWWPVAIYTSPTAPELRNAETVWWDSWKQKAFSTPPTEWTAFFGRPAQEEHPHEISAVIAVAGDNTTEAGRRLLNWLQTQPTLLN